MVAWSPTLWKETQPAEAAFFFFGFFFSGPLGADAFREPVCSSCASMLT